MFYVRKIEFSPGYILPLLFTKNKSQPCGVLLRYVLFNLRFKASSTSLRNKIYCLKRFYEFVGNQNASIEDLILTSASDKSKQISDLCEGYTYYILSSISSNRQSTAYRNLLLVSLIKFIEFVNQEYALSIRTALPRSFILEPSKSNSIKRKTRDIDPKYLDTLVQISSPDSHYNPFKNDLKIRIRNMLLISILVETGIRIGELMSLKTTSYNEIRKRFYLEISQNSSSLDTRHSPGNLKNIQSNRNIAISKELFVLLDHYTTTLRRVFIKEPTEFLFLSEKGRPLSKQAILDLISKLSRQANSILNVNHDIKPHDFRYSFANNFLAYLVEIREYEMGKALDELRVIMGWKVNSTMPSKYASNFIADVANISNLQRIQNLYDEQ